MSHLSTHPRRTGLIGAACLLLLALAYGIGGSTITYAFASDPLGPRVFPVILAIALAVLCIFYARTPGDAEEFPRGLTMVRIMAIPVTLIVFCLLMETIGFPIMVFCIVTIISALFGASFVLSAIGGVIQAALWWFIFSYLLEVYLPVGSLFS